MTTHRLLQNDFLINTKYIKLYVAIKCIVLVYVQEYINHISIEKSTQKK